ncbi:cysteine/serine endopeptidase inhibitor [Kitasatospora sp. NPDC001683]
MPRSNRIRLWAGSLLAAGSLTLLAAGPATADVPVDQPVDGTATYYNDAGNGACGTPINASTDLLVAVPAAYWTAANPNSDPLCQGVSVQVTYNGTTITVPVADKCPTCDPAHIDLSAPAFQQLADPNLGVINVTWTFVQNNGS